MSNMKVALVYDRVNKWGGAERLLLSLKKIFPNAPLFTSVYHSRASWASKFNIKTSFLQELPFASSFHEGFAALMPIAFENFSFDDYDVVISITSEAAKGVITKPGTLHICYCLTPTRYLWSGYNTYFKNSYLRILSKPLVFYLKTWDRIAAQRPDHFIAISKEVKGRIKKYYGRESKVIYPPQTLLEPGSINPSKGKYFLIVSRLVPYKNLELAVKACSDLNLPLKVVGKGSQEIFLKRIAGKTVQFAGELTDEELKNYYKNCKALIFPGIEDLGLTMIEAQAFGKPVIALKKGGALEIVNEKTGIFFDEWTVDSLKSALVNFDESRYNTQDCFENARRFSFKHFENNLNEFIQQNFV